MSDANLTGEHDALRIGADTANLQSDTDTDRLLRQLGVFTPQRLGKLVEGNLQKPYLVPGLLRSKSINLFVGDSGLGKTPFGIQLGLCVAAGLPFLGRTPQQGRVLYCDAETDATTFHETIQSIARFLGLGAAPAEFAVWSPNWETRSGPLDSYRNWSERVLSIARELNPALVILDPLRMFWPDLEAGNDRVPLMIKDLRRSEATWLITHHRRKLSRTAPAINLEEEPHLWFQEAAGAHAIVNQTDARIGVVKDTGEADLLVGGFLRGSGPFPSMRLKRPSDPATGAQGYELVHGVELLSGDDRAAFQMLPEDFTFTQAKRALGGTSDSNTQRLLKRCLEVGIVIKNGTHYSKVSLPTRPMDMAAEVLA